MRRPTNTAASSPEPQACVGPPWGQAAHLFYRETSISGIKPVPLLAVGQAKCLATCVTRLKNLTWRMLLSFSIFRCFVERHYALPRTLVRSELVARLVIGVTKAQPIMPTRNLSNRSMPPVPRLGVYQI
jgi:hypothetical protein